MSDSISRYRERVVGCWLGKAVGGTLGMPYEGCSGPLDLTFYRPVPNTMLPNDDLDLQVLWACLLNAQDHPRVSSDLFVKGWREHINFPWDEYGVCKRNLRNGILPPLSGSFDNWFANGMGAAIRSELWACLAPGNPTLAAAYAREDACLDHAGEGLWAEVWLAAMQSAAFVESDIHKVIAIGFEHIPEGTQLRRSIEDTQRWWNESHDWKRVRGKILENYGHENFTNVTENLAFIYLALLDGRGDFSRSICTAANCGKDTDCTAATVGALLGIMAPESISEDWLRPIGRNLVLSPEITGIKPPDSLDTFTDMVINLRERLRGKIAVRADALGLPRDMSIPARVGCADSDWFGHGWQIGRPLDLIIPPMKSIRFEGSFVTMDSKAFDKGAVFVEYRFILKRTTHARVIFNTHENCRVFLNGKYVFGRESGRMAPSPHRIPNNQSIDVRLDIGEHKLLAVLKKPESSRKMEWVVGVSDGEDNDQWIPDVWIR
ncbi:ADP-ribosylglycohydrolase family protein [Ruficoccus amylovorans]|uniref:ADP-ribosylglycohydrolase family protein n=1 Tax=Ruficoccus amylovorans TaxID=1804625 RepID=A0A842HDR4_9BACT|nr:ADP-ribosylglycohydrolase family protein [Ruficoccus amylovorans]MBC2593816.1 ADP-ribosylglycohydrolase family protein [Ruficoccus amylovorans]